MGSRVYTGVLRAGGVAYLSPPAACPQGCIQGQGAAEGPREWPTSQGRVVRAGLAEAAFWVNIVLGFFFISLQTSPSQHRPHNPKQGPSVLLTQRHKRCHSSREIKLGSSHNGGISSWEEHQQVRKFNKPSLSPALRLGSGFLLFWVDFSLPKLCWFHAPPSADMSAPDNGLFLQTMVSVRNVAGGQSLKRDNQLSESSGRVGDAGRVLLSPGQPPQRYHL